MAEDLPQDPNQVQPPQEGQPDQQPQDQTGHIEVAYHDEGQEQVAEGEQSAPEAVETHQDGTEDNEPTHLGTIDHDDDSTKLTPEEEQQNLGRIRNKDKAEVMAHAQNDVIKENRKLERQGRYEDLADEYEVEWAAEDEGREYEIRNALATYAHEGVNTPAEALRLARHDRDAFLKYSHAIAESQRKHGDELNLGLEAIDKVYDFQQQITKLGGDKLWKSQGYRISAQEKSTVGNFGDLDALLIRSSGEEWTLSMFDGGDYEVSKHEYDTDGEFQYITTTKRRAITEEDVAKLDKTLTGWVESDRSHAENEKRRQYYEELEDDDSVSMAEVRRRARAHFGNTEEAREAAEKYPGDFM
jgi:hypothetical protein